MTQSLEDLELIIITDRATAPTHRIIDTFMKQDRRLLKIESTGNGLSRALNTGLTAANAPYVCRLDDDDIMFTDRLSIQKRVLDRDASIVCVGSQVVYFGDQKNLSTSRLPLEDWQIRAEAMFSNPVAHPSLMLRREVMESLSGYSSVFRYAQDYELLSRLLSKGRIKNLSRPLTAYRVHKDQATRIASRAQRAPYELAALASVQAKNKLKSFSEERLEKYLKSGSLEQCFLDDSGSSSRIARAALILRSSGRSTISWQWLKLVLSAIRVSPTPTLTFLYSKSLAFATVQLKLGIFLVVSRAKKSDRYRDWLRTLYC